MSKRTNGQTGDEETDAILADMEKDGEGDPFDTVSDEDEEEAAEDKGSKEDESEDEEEDGDSDEEEDESEDDDEDEESDEDESEDEDKGSEDEEEDDAEDEASEDGEEEDSDEEDEDEAEKPVQGRVPVWQRLREEKKARKAAEAQLADALKGKSVETIDSMAESFAKKHGFKVEAAKDLLESAAALAAKQSGLDPSTKKALDQIVKRDSEHSYWDGQERAFKREFRSTIAPLAKRDGIDPAKAERILQSLVFKPEHSKISTVQLYLDHVATATKKGKITTESGRRRVHANASKQIDELSASDIEEMSDKEFAEFSDNLGKSSRSKITRRN